MGQCQTYHPCDALDFNTPEPSHREETLQMDEQTPHNVIPLEPDEKIDDFSFDVHGPPVEYAIKLTHAQQNDFKIPEPVQALQKKLGSLYVKGQLNPQLKLFPFNEEPYFIHSLEALYIGQWRYGQPWSQGILYYTSGDIYEGYSKNGIPQGTGRKYLQDGTYYIGHFEDGQVNGHGKLFKPNGFSYDGYWINNLPDGKGVEKWPNLTTYAGQYKEGRKNGFGRFSWPLKKTDLNAVINENYQGLFKDDLFEGQGQYEWTDGRNYSGNWREGKMDGLGEFNWKDGRKYIGEYFRDLKHGQGIFTWPDGKKWEGKWSLGKMDGIGNIIMPNSKIYQGEWSEGKRLRWIKDKDVDNRSVISNFSNKFVLGAEHEETMLNQLSEIPSVIIQNKLVSDLRISNQIVSQAPITVIQSGSQ